MSLSAVAEAVNGHHSAKLATRPLIWRETQSATEINRILNDDEVFPFIAGPDQAPYDLTEAVKDPRLIFLRSDGGVVLLVADAEAGSGVYELHANFLPERRGKPALTVMRAALEWLFTRTDAAQVWCRIVDNNLAVLGMVRALHMWPWFTKEQVQFNDGIHDVSYYGLTIHDWMRHADKLVETGQWFFDHLASEFRRYGSPREEQRYPEAAQRAAGMAFLMLRGGQPHKGVVLHNRWARAAGSGQIGLVSLVPLTVDVGDALIHVADDSFKLIRVK